ncbi:hypothetical protein [Desulfomicrobium salsuginis]
MSVNELREITVELHFSVSRRRDEGAHMLGMAALETRPPLPTAAWRIEESDTMLSTRNP